MEGELVDVDNITPYQQNPNKKTGAPLTADRKSHVHIARPRSMSSYRGIAAKLFDVDIVTVLTQVALQYYISLARAQKGFDKDELEELDSFLSHMAARQVGWVDSLSSSNENVQHAIPCF